LAAQGFAFVVREFPESTRTSAEAAAAIGCAVGEIAKSLVFRGAESGEPVLIIASGSNRVDPAKAAGLLGEAIKRADADFVRAATGFAIGGVMAFAAIWAAAGTPNAVFRLSPRDLVDVTGGKIGDLKQDA
jgi:prolyl-tRNA editing enzyme YbaK/EbsC (Cys-tRNA(Pro) deacylase)